MNKPTVENISILFEDKSERYAAMMTVDVVESVQYVLLYDGEFNETGKKYA